MNTLHFWQLTDTHFRQDYNDGFFSGIEWQQGTPTENLVSILQQAASSHTPPDFIVISGDMVHEGTPGDYAFFKQLIQECAKGIPVYPVLGNHDWAASYWEGYEGKVGCTDRLYYETTIRGFRLIVLDSSHDNSGIGVVDADQLQWLSNVLKTPAEHGSILIVHHPLEMGEVHAGLALTNSRDVLELLQDSDVIAVLSGHTHQNKASAYGNVLLSVSESTAFGAEFTKNSYRINDRTGYATYCVNGHGISLQSTRLPGEIHTLREYSFEELRSRHS